MSKSPGLVIDVREGQEVTFDTCSSLGKIRVIVEKKEGKRARLRVVADKGIIVSRPAPESIAVQAA